MFNLSNTNANKYFQTLLPYKIISKVWIYYLTFIHKNNVIRLYTSEIYMLLRFENMNKVFETFGYIANTYTLLTLDG
jgi:hypothetical protein